MLVVVGAGDDVVGALLAAVVVVVVVAVVCDGDDDEVDEVVVVVVVVVVDGISLVEVSCSCLEVEEEMAHVPHCLGPWRSARRTRRTRPQKKNVVQHSATSHCVCLSSGHCW